MVYNLSVKNSISVTDDNVEANLMGHLLKKMGKISGKAGRELATNVLKNTGKALQIGAENGSSAVYRNNKAALFTVQVVQKPF